MKTRLLFALMLLLAPVCVSAQDWNTVGPPIFAALDVDAQGHVVRAQLTGTKALPQLQALVNTTTRDWQFVPATVGGKPVPSRTYARFRVEMREAGGSKLARLHYVTHGPGSVRVDPPQYPRGMIRQLVGASVLVGFDVNGDGSVSHVRVVTAKTSDGVRGAPFYKACIEAIGNFRFLPERVDGRPVVTHMRMPVNFNITGRLRAGSLRHALDAPHLEPGKGDIDVPHFADVPFALDSPLRFATATP